MARTLVFHDVSFGYDVPLLEGVRLTFQPGWTCILGENGAGKTTLLRLAAGELEPDSGEIRRPSGSVAWCHQRVDEPSADLLAFAADDDALASRWKSRLDLTRRPVASWRVLSPGERRRWQVGAALASDADILLLDEPTNHLDRASVEMLVGALADYAGIGLLVSHDRSFAERLASATVWVERPQVRMLALGPLEAWAQWQGDRAQQREQMDLASKALQQAEKQAQRERATLADATGQRSSRSRMKNAGDRDATSSLAKGRAAQAEKTLGRRAQVARDKLDRVEEARAALAPIEKERGRTIQFEHRRSRKPRAIAVRVGPLFGGDRLLLAASDIVLADGQHVWLEGANGSGKTTLLEALANECLADALYIPQILSEERTRASLDALRSLPPDARGNAMQLLAALGAPPLRVAQTTRPSPGEARKVAIAEALLAEPSLLLLDEPTNDLDFASVERLEGALLTWPGALLLVTHDALLARKVCAEAWLIEPEGIVRRDP